MQRSLFQRLFAVALMASLFSLNSCQKDNSLVTDPSVTTPDGTATQRNPVYYGVTVYGSPAKPSRVVEIDEATGTVLGAPWSPMFNGNPILDIKGICYLNGTFKYAITTGPNAGFGVPANSLFTLNVATQQATLLSNCPTTISDIDYDPIAGEIYGLVNNSSNIITIGGGGFGVYGPVTPIVGLPAGAVASGLTMVGDINNVIECNVAVQTFGLAANVSAYRVNPATGLSGFIANILPLANHTGANLGMGYQLRNTSQMYLNRNTATLVPGPGLSQSNWAPAGAVANFAVYGGAGFNFEDLSSDINIPF